MEKARGEERRKVDSLKSWGIGVPKGFIERRRSVERRRPVVTEGSLEEFDHLMQSFKKSGPTNPDQGSTALDRLIGHL